jgi:DNA-binding IclR family transcriptional regulator
MVLEGNGVRFIDGVEGMHVLRVGSPVGMLLPAHRTSGGKALLAELSREELRALYPRDLPGDPATARATLERQLATIRRRGYATNLGESERGIAAVGACVRDASRRAVAALAVAMPSARCPRARLPDLAAAVIDVATTASRTLHSI